MTAMSRHLQSAPSLQDSGEEVLVIGKAYRLLLSAKADRLKRSHGTILISGETGTGKSLAARYLYEKSDVYKSAFRVISLNEIPESLFESQLFGHRKGAFTGADQDFDGKIKSGDRGTVVLEDIPTLPLHLQTKLLRVIENREFERIGDLEVTRVDIRIIATTNTPLAELVQKGVFRRDLFYRLAVIEIKIPALRERPEDLEPLVLHYLQKIATSQGKRLTQLDPEALRLLRSYPWPGNVRELIGEIEYVISLADPDLEILSPGDLSERIQANNPILPVEGDSLDQVVRRTEREKIVQALVRNGAHRGKAARDLGISRRTLYNKMIDLGIRF
jgi:transcriptional regulator with PAS, ATPase and Fis domain